MILKLKRFSFPFLLLSVIGLDTNAQTNGIDGIVHAVRQKYAPDARTAVFDISFRSGKKGIVLTGEVDNPAARLEIFERIQKSTGKKILNKIRLLPDPELGKDTIGIVLCDAADIRRRPSEKEELISQALMGTGLKILKKAGADHYYIQMPDLYLGWIEKRDIFITDIPGRDRWNGSDRAIVTALKSEIKERPSVSSPSLSNAVMGCIVKTKGKKNGWTSVELADGSSGFLPDAAIQDLKFWRQSRQLTGENLEKTAESFLGIPYLWGGTSVKGMDCSGFTKTVYRMNGMELNRDANQQAEQGTNVQPGENFRDLKKGDLIFFGRKADSGRNEQITHVGLYLGDLLFIHSSKKVAYCSFNPSSKYYEASRSRQFVRARRLF